MRGWCPVHDQRSVRGRSEIAFHLLLRRPQTRRLRVGGCFLWKPAVKLPARHLDNWLAEFTRMREGQYCDQFIRSFVCTPGRVVTNSFPNVSNEQPRRRRPNQPGPLSIDEMGQVGSVFDGDRGRTASVHCWRTGAQVIPSHVVVRAVTEWAVTRWRGK